MPSYIVRDTMVMLHSHPFLNRSLGVPITVQVDDRSHRITVSEVLVDGHEVEADNAMCLQNVDIRYDTENDVAHVGDKGAV